MAMAGRTSAWNGPQLAAHWLASRAPLPRPITYAIYRETTRASGEVTSRYTIQGDPASFGSLEFEQWRTARDLDGEAGLRLALLTVREVLDASGAIRECVIERRRGAIDGPYCGDPARIEFIGAARSVRLYTADGVGRLTEAAPPSTQPPPRQDITDGFRGEEAAIRAHFGPTAMVMDRRSPTLFEEMAGLASIVHVRDGDRDRGCGVGWFGPMPYLLIAEFPRLDHGLALPPAEEGAVAAALRAHDLVRHEMRLDAEGLCVIASERNRPNLFVVRPDGTGARVLPYAPGGTAVGSDDQRRWIRYAEAHEGRVALDAYQDGASDELVVLTGDDQGQVWRHRIDPDGVEVACGPANETAVAMLYRARQPGAPPMSEPEPGTTEAVPVPWPDPPLEVDSLLARTRAAVQVATIFQHAAEPNLPWHHTLARLAELWTPLRSLGAIGTGGELRRLSRTEALAPPSEADRLRAVEALRQRFEAELAGLRVAPMAADWRELAGDDDPGAIAEWLPEAVYHVQEAGRCLRLRRPAASVFHALGALRAGLRLLPDGDALATAASWQALMSAVRARPGIATPIVDSLRQLRRAWHSRLLLPADKYTEEEAEAVLAALDGFLRALAAAVDPERLD